MAIPDYQSVMLPLLKLAHEKKDELNTREAVEILAQQFSLSDEELHALIPSGTQATFENRVRWAATYLKKAGLLEATRRGHFRITDRAKEVLTQSPLKIDNSFLRQFPEFVEFTSLKGTRSKSQEDVEEDVEENDPQNTPLESLETAYLRLRQELAAELQEKVKTCSPSFFERLVVELIVSMGYGGSREDAGRAIGRSGDGGIDGIIKEDRLGLDVIYIQAKRWNNNPIGRPDVQQFAGALQGQRAGKGIFITTSRFTQDARDFVEQIGSKIVLIDGETLAQYMIDFNVGVSRASVYEIKRVDSDYFDEGI